MQTRRLGRTDMDVSVLSFGASSLGSVFREVTDPQATDTVARVLDLGINFIDVSPFYGLTLAETRLGRALQGVPRDRYYLATKCGRYGQTVADCDFSADRVTRSIDESLARLGTDYLDLIQVHDMEYGSLDQIVEETLPALQRAKQAGKARYVGITGLPLTNFVTVTDRAAPGSIDTILSYCHYELNDTALLGILDNLESKGIGVINASPLGMGLLSNRGTPDWHPAPDQVKAACTRAAEHCAANGASLMKLAVQFSLREPRIATTLVGSANPDNMTTNAAWADKPIDEQLLAEVQAILAPIHNVTWPQGRAENN